MSLGGNGKHGPPGSSPGGRRGARPRMPVSDGASTAMGVGCPGGSGLLGSSGGLICVLQRSAQVAHRRSWGGEGVESGASPVQSQSALLHSDASSGNWGPGSRSQHASRTPARQRAGPPTNDHATLRMSRTRLINSILAAHPDSASPPRGTPSCPARYDACGPRAAGSTGLWALSGPKCKSLCRGASAQPRVMTCILGQASWPPGGAATQ